MRASARTPNLPRRLPVYPLHTRLRLRFGVHRCLACGRIGQGSLQPASLLVPPQVARTWRCADRLACAGAALSGVISGERHAWPIRRAERGHLVGVVPYLPVAHRTDADRARSNELPRSARIRRGDLA
jgi:hypothetical protein